MKKENFEKNAENRLIKILEKEQNEMKIKNTKKKFDEIVEDRKTYLQNRLNENNQRVKIKLIQILKTKSMNNFFFREKSLILCFKREDNQDRLQRFENIQEFKKNQKLEKIKQDYRRMEEIK